MQAPMMNMTAPADQTQPTSEAPKTDEVKTSSFKDVSFKMENLKVAEFVPAG